VYRTQKGTDIIVYKGKKPQSDYDFIVRYREAGKKERTPRHIHLVAELYVKYAHKPRLTLELKEHLLETFAQIKPIDYFPPKLQVFRKEDVALFKELDEVGEYDVEFLLVVSELIMIQEKTNYPEGSLTESLYRKFGVEDRFAVINAAVFRRL